MSHVQTIQAIYDAFGRGAVDEILPRLAEDVEWEYGTSSTEVPWLQPRRGRSGAAAFFGALAALEIRNFRVSLIAGSEDTVIALCDLEAIVGSTGRPIVEADEVHIWHFDRDGLVSRFRHRVDTHQHWLAMQSEAKPAYAG